jgi:hypothetical protein
MEFDFKTLLYLAFGILYFIFSAKKKGAKKNELPTNSDRGGETLGPPPSRQTTFEELLQEFTGKRTETLQPVSAPVEPKLFNQPKPSTQPQPLFMEVPKIERSTILENAAKNKRAAAIQLALEENEEDEYESESYAEAFSSMDGAKRAFVFSEIFKRKY